MLDLVCVQAWLQYNCFDLWYVSIYTFYVYYEAYKATWAGVSIFLADVWLFFGLGNASRLHPSPQRLKVHWDERLQLCHDVHHRSTAEPRPLGPTKRLLCHHLNIHHFLYHGHPLSRIHPKSKIKTQMRNHMYVYYIYVYKTGVFQCYKIIELFVLLLFL